MTIKDLNAENVVAVPVGVKVKCHILKTKQTKKKKKESKS